MGADETQSVKTFRLICQQTETAFHGGGIGLCDLLRAAVGCICFDFRVNPRAAFPCVFVLFEQNGRRAFSANQTGTVPVERPRRVFRHFPCGRMSVSLHAAEAFGDHVAEFIRAARNGEIGLSGKEQSGGEPDGLESRRARRGRGVDRTADMQNVRRVERGCMRGAFEKIHRGNLLPSSSEQQSLKRFLKHAGSSEG